MKPLIFNLDVSSSQSLHYVYSLAVLEIDLEKKGPGNISFIYDRFNKTVLKYCKTIMTRHVLQSCAVLDTVHVIQ